MKTYKLLVYIQVYTGNYRGQSRSTREVLAVPDTGALQQGHLVAVTCENCELEPLIAKVVQIEEDNFKIEWLEGAYSKPWRNAKQRDPKKNRKVIPWTDVIPKQSIILFALH